MKTMIFSLAALIGLLLVALQHQQIGQLRKEKAGLQQAATEADQLRADLAKSSNNEAQDAEEIARLREENRDLLKLRNEVNQLSDARAEFERVSGENKRLQATASARKADAKQTAVRPITVRIEYLYNRGQSTPENAVQTLFWAEREGDTEALSRCVTSESWPSYQDFYRNGRKDGFDNINSLEIVARRDIDATTVQLGIQFHNTNPAWDTKVALTLVLRDGQWRVASKFL